MRRGKIEIFRHTGTASGAPAATDRIYCYYVHYVYELNMLILTHNSTGLLCLIIPFYDLKLELNKPINKINREQISFVLTRMHFQPKTVLNLKKKNICELYLDEAHKIVYK